MFEREREVEREERGSCEVSSSSFPSNWLTAPSPCVGTFTREWNRIRLFVSLGEHYDSLPIIGRYNHYPAYSGQTWVSASYPIYPLSCVLVRALFSCCASAARTGHDVTAEKNYELPLHPLFDSSSLRHGIGKRTALWKNVELFTAHAINFVMNLTRARYYFIFRDSLNDDAWHFARFYITRRMYETNKWNERGIIFRKYWKRFWMTLLSSLFIKYSWCQLFRLYSHNSITRRLLICFRSSRIMFSIRKIWPRHTAGISVSKFSNINFVVIMRCGPLENDDVTSVP